MRRIKRRKTKNFLRNNLGLLIVSVIFYSVVFYFLYTTFVPKYKLLSPVPVFSKGNLAGFFYFDEKSKIEADLRKNNISYSLISVSPNDARVDLTDGTKVIFSMKKNYSQQISSLQLILLRSTIEGKKFSVIDFRFDKPLIRLR